MTMRRSFENTRNSGPSLATLGRGCGEVAALLDAVTLRSCPTKVKELCVGWVRTFRPREDRKMRLVFVALLASIAVIVTGATASSAADPVQCGVISNYVPATASTAGSFDLATTSGTLKVAVPAGQVGRASGYACVGVSGGANGLVLTGFLTNGAPGYVPQQAAVGPLPSTSTQPSSGSPIYAVLSALVLAGALAVVALKRRELGSAGSAPGGRERV